MRPAAFGVLRLLVSLSAIAGGDVVLPQAAVAQDGQARVLTLYATRRDAQIVVVGDRILQDMLGRGLTNGVDYYSEYLDQGRFFDTDYQTAFRDSLTLKYARYRFDLVVAVGNVPTSFVAQNQDGLFKDVPLLYFVDNPLPQPIPRSTGFVVPVDLAATVTFAQALQPDLRHVFVVTGASQTFEKTARAQLHRFESQFDVTFLSGLPTQSLEARLRTLPPRSMVLYMSVDRDGANQNFRPLDYLDRVSAVANAPIYSWVDSAIDHGIVGGSLKSQEAEFQAMGETALRLLRGESVEAIPVSSPDLDEKQADWRQLRRWQLSESRLPAGTIVRFHEPSVWDQYQGYIVAIVAGLLLQTALIAGLLVQRRRRRQAEREVQEKQAALQSSYERIRDLGGRLLTAQDTERARIAGELHDDIGQQLALLAVELHSLPHQLDGAAGDAIMEATLRVDDVQRSVHDLSHRLHPEKLRLIGLLPSLEGLEREFSHSGVRVRFTHPPFAGTFAPDVTLCLFRVAQEAVQNAIKHGGVHEVGLSVQLEATNELSLCIEDDGHGFDVERAWGSGLGLISMRERLESIGGRLEIDSRPGAGTRVRAIVPAGAVDNTVAASA